MKKHLEYISCLKVDHIIAHIFSIKQLQIKKKNDHIVKIGCKLKIGGVILKYK